MAKKDEKDDQAPPAESHVGPDDTKLGPGERFMTPAENAAVDRAEARAKDPIRGEPVDADDAARVAKLKSEQSAIGARLLTAEEAKRKADAEYAALTAQAQMKNAEIMKVVGTPSQRPTTIMEHAEAAKRRGERLVTCLIPKSFTHRIDDHTTIDVVAGARQVPESFADHWWARANGVVRAEG